MTVTREALVEQVPNLAHFFTDEEGRAMLATLHPPKLDAEARRLTRNARKRAAYHAKMQERRG